ncbi:hypothetical protein SAY86_001365 [Trapa natans]|uniref:Fe2OG dioxygenase domain-containing protein n=1 Tax=Trapa natans TaxID=22666 RepID=A0AAN7RGF3_TRANT|nr:hypothetical protein SAY86_001365 [Trapa natans]
MSTERVQTLSSTTIRQLPARFVRLPHEQPANSKAIDGVTVPVISLAGPSSGVVDQIRRACSEWGFFLATDHGIPGSLIERLKEVGIEFFKLPQAEKEKLANDHLAGDLEGYGTKMTKNHEEKVEWIDYYFHLMSPASKVRHEKWPHHPPSYRKVTEEYNREMLRMTEELLGMLSEGLGLEKGAMRKCLGGDDIELEMKINFYPPCPQPELALGVEPHTDMSALTILVTNDVPGLQVWKDGNWVAVHYDIPHALFVHVGDQIEVRRLQSIQALEYMYNACVCMDHGHGRNGNACMQVLSNGKYKGVLHRSLVNREKTRMSWAVFTAPQHEATIGPIPELIDDQNPPKYTARTFAEFRYRKFNKLPLN